MLAAILGGTKNERVVSDMDLNSMHYINSMNQIMVMRKKALITDKDFIKVEEKLCKKYCIKIDSLIRKNYLINYPFRVMYIGEKEEKT